LLDSVEELFSVFTQDLPMFLAASLPSVLVARERRPREHYGIDTSEVGGQVTLGGGEVQGVLEEPVQ
jgi:hypothetical protein